MALDSTSDLSDALDQYNDNLSWEGDRDKAINCLAAIRWLLVNRPRIIADAGTTVNYETLSSEKEKLEEFIANTNTTTRSYFTRANLNLP